MFFVECLQKKLHTLTMESDQLKTEINQRNDLLSRIDAETHMVDKVLITIYTNHVNSQLYMRHAVTIWTICVQYDIA